MKVWMKKMCAVCLAIATLCSLGLFVGCGGKEKLNEKMLYIGVYNTRIETGAIDRVIADFKRDNPDFLTKHELDDISVRGISRDEYSTKIQGMARTQTLPDIFLGIDTLAPMFARQKVSLNLTPYIEAEEEYKRIVADMYPQMREQGEFVSTDAQGEKVTELHMVAREYSRVVVYYNKVLLKEAGLDEPTNDWTWSDFERYSKALVKKGGKDNSAVIQNGADLTLTWPAYSLSVLKGLGGAVFDADGKAAMDETTAAAYTELKALVDSGAVVNNWRGIGTSFANKTVAMTVGTRASIGDIKQYFENADDWGVVCFPDMSAENGDKPYIGTGTSGYSVSAKSRHKDAAVEFLMYLLSANGQKALASSGNFVPVRQSMKNESFWQSGLNIGLASDFNHAAFTVHSDRDLAPFGSQIQSPAKQTEVLNALNDVTESVLYGGVGDNASVWATSANKTVNDAM